MKKQSTHKNHKISFKRWKRTSWAVFASLKVVVHNCCTRIASFKDSLLKQQGSDRSELVSLSIDIDPTLESEDIGVFWEDEQLLLEYSLPKITPTKPTKEVSMILLFYSYISLSTKLILSVGIFHTLTL